MYESNSTESGTMESGSATAEQVSALSRGSAARYPGSAEPSGVPALGDPQLAALIARILSVSPFAGRSPLDRIRSNLNPPYDYAIAIPVRNEEEWLPRTLGALDRTMRTSAERGAVVFVLNDTSDRSAEVIARFAAARDMPVAAIEIGLDPAIRSAPHARRVALDVAVSLAPDGHLLTSDSDTHVGPLWVRSCLAALRDGYALVCEDIRLDEAELAALPPAVQRVGDVERAYFEACEQLWQLWTGGRAGAFAYRASGASLGLASAAYREVGGLPLPDRGEDAALCDAVLASGQRVRQLRDIGTRTSARLSSRAEGGCGQTLSHRSRCEDPECDDALVPLRVLRERAMRPGDPKSSGLRDGTGSLRYSEVARELGKAQRLLFGMR